MKISFMELYIQVGASFDLGKVLSHFSKKLNLLGVDVPVLEKKFGTSNFELAFTVSSKKNVAGTYFKGPAYKTKANRAEVSIFILYRELEEFSDRIEYVLMEISKGMSAALTQLDSDIVGLEGCARELVAEVNANPSDFQWVRN